MKRTCCNTLAILAATSLLAGPALGKDDPSVSESKTPVDTSASSATMAPAHPRVAATSLNVDQIRELQRLLNDRGYRAGAADGIMGPRTMAAIRQFQTANKLTVNGTPDQATLRVLAPDAKKMEFFGVAPAYGETEGTRKQPIQKERGKMMEQPIQKEPGKMMEQPIQREPGKMMEQPIQKEPGKMMEQPMKKGY